MTAAPVVHLATAQVATVLREAPQSASWLSADESRRLVAMRSDRRQDEFLAARWQARCLLAQVEGGAPQDWPLEAAPDAPPRVPQRADLFLSVSHSRGWVACALSRQPIGIDLEVRRAGRDIDGLVGLCCGGAEARMFDGLAPPQREALFYELWTVKEAWLKCRGDWLAPARLRQLDARPAARGTTSAWVGPGWSLAACAAAASQFRWWTPLPSAGRMWALRDHRVAMA
jgi:4'-phosphopantetheinyl transferase